MVLFILFFKKENNKIIRELRYFRIKNGVLYWYLNERSRESQNKIKLADVEDIFPHPNPEKNKKFKIVNKFWRFLAKKIFRKSLKKGKSISLWQKQEKTVIFGSKLYVRRFSELATK